MWKHALIVLLCSALLIDLSGCTRRYRLDAPPEIAPELTDEWIVAATTKSGEVVEFDATILESTAWSGSAAGKPHAIVRNDSLFGIVGGAPYSIALADVDHLWLKVEKVDPVLTTLAVVGAVVTVSFVVLVIAFASWDDDSSGSSCPFVYSWDGNQYVLDAEPYAGAITRGLERDDYSELEHLRPIDGSYRLLLANEMSETDYTNLVELWLVDHRPGQEVAAAADGRLYDVTGALPPLAATDDMGRDLRAWLAATDKLVWEPAPEATTDGRMRTEIVVTFPRPAGSQEAQLVANVQTGTWGALMIRELLDLRGNQLPWFYTAIDAIPAAQESLRAWNAREELFLLQIEVEEDDGWQVRGLVPGNARAPENVVVPLDIRHVRGNELRLRIRPPVGFWALNSFAVDYAPEGPPLAVRVLAPTRAVDGKGDNVLPQLLADDETYHVMPQAGNRASLEFPAPALASGRARSIFLHSRGYYRLHLPADHEPDVDRLEQIATVPDAATRFAVDRFTQYRAARARLR